MIFFPIEPTAQLCVQVDMRQVLIVIMLLTATVGAAQHCGYDGASVLVVHPHAPGDTAVYDGLRITLLDSMNIPYEWGGRACTPFFRNNNMEAFDERYINHHPQHGDEYIFPFAMDNYVLVIPRVLDLTGWHILIQEFDCEWFQPCALQQLIPLTNFDSYSLCDTYDADEYPIRSDRPAYKPVDVILSVR